MKTKLKINVISESVFTAKGHGVHTAFIETVESLKRAGMDVAVNSNRAADVVHVHTVGPYSLKKLLGAKGKKVISAHVTPDSFVGSLVGAKYWHGLAKVYLRWFYNRADGVLAVSQEVVDELKEMGVKKPIFLMPNTIDTMPYQNNAHKKLEARKALGIGQSDFLVISVGQVQPRKRVDTFIASAQALPQYRFIWVGGLPFKRFAADFNAMSHIMERPPANVKFTGVIDHEQVIQYYQAADVFFLPSIQETFGIVIVEAAAAGLPILLRDIDQYKLTFGDGYIPAGDDTFAAEIERLATDNKYRLSYIENAKKIAATYDSVKGTEHLLAAYRSILNA